MFNSGGNGRFLLGKNAGTGSFAGYDAPLFINLTGNRLANPMLGDDPSGLDSLFGASLLTGGTAPQWSSAGAQTLGLLGADAVWETLIPSGDDFINASAAGTIPVASMTLGDGGVAYLVATPEPAAIGLLGFGLIGPGCVRGLRRPARSGRSTGALRL